MENYSSPHVHIEKKGSFSLLSSSFRDKVCKEEDTLLAPSLLQYHAPSTTLPGFNNSQTVKNSGLTPVSCSWSSFHPAKMVMTSSGRDWPWLRVFSYVLVQATGRLMEAEHQCCESDLNSIWMWIYASRPSTRCPHWFSMSPHNNFNQVDVTAWTKKPPLCFLSPLSDLLAIPACIQNPGVKGRLPLWGRPTIQAIHVLSYKASWPTFFRSWMNKKDLT